MRSNRNHNQLRDISFETNLIKHADGSCLVKLGDTHVLCAANLTDKVPKFVKNTGKGWISAEYGMLPTSTNTRIPRESHKGRISGRTHEIQRLIARSLRTAVNLNMLGERQIIVDCDVLQADGGTRVAAITGGYVALHIAINKLCARKKIAINLINHQVTAISCGIIGDKILLDLEYSEDSKADVDANFVMNEQGKLIEIQISAENALFTYEQMQSMLDLATSGIETLMAKQREVLLHAIK